MTWEAIQGHDRLRTGKRRGRRGGWGDTADAGIMAGPADQFARVNFQSFGNIVDEVDADAAAIAAEDPG